MSAQYFSAALLQACVKTPPYYAIRYGTWTEFVAYGFVGRYLIYNGVIYLLAYYKEGEGYDLSN